ncbi:MAG: CDP-alcohol phosphatidyltransferase family protein [Paracoccus sp. (in: a-proteobacteria)]
MPDNPPNRRPLASRDTGWARRLSVRLAATPVTPNQISMAGMVAALISGLCFWAVGYADGFGRALLLILAAGMCQIRLLCNLLDGMVAIEAGRGAPDGGFWNEFPDRISDALILVGVGLGLGAAALGWAAVSFAFLTAYLRELGSGLGQPADFSGPMAKPHRMALITGAALLAIPEPSWGGDGGVLRIALWIIVLGAALTVLRRSDRLVASLRR